MLAKRKVAGSDVDHELGTAGGFCGVHPSECRTLTGIA